MDFERCTLDEAGTGIVESTLLFYTLINIYGVIPYNHFVKIERGSMMSSTHELKW